MGALGGIVLLVFALLAVGCGSSDSKELSKAEFVKQGNAICTQATKARDKALTELIQNANPGTSQEDLRKEAADKVMPFYEGAAEDIGDLSAPKGSEAKAEALVDAMEEAAAKVRANPQLAATGNQPFRKADQVAESLGLEDCTI
jgi:hypothetical protein